MTGDKETGKDSPEEWKNSRETSCNRVINMEGLIREEDYQVLLED